jgi:hypothetical protein
MNFPKTIILIAIIFQFPISLSKFAPYFQKCRKKSYYRRSGNRKSTIIDGLLAKGFVVTWNFQRSNPRGKETRYRAIISRKAIVIQWTTSWRKKKKFVDASEWIAWRCFYRPRNSDILCITSGDSYPLLTSFARTCVARFSFFREIYVSDEARYENYEQAKLIQNHLIETYEGYGYRLVRSTERYR